MPINDECFMFFREKLMESGSDVLFEDEEGELVGWKVADGTYVQSDAVLLMYQTASGEKKSLRTPVAGVVTVDVTVKKGKVASVPFDNSMNRMLGGAFHFPFCEQKIESNCGGRCLRRSSSFRSIIFSEIPKRMTSRLCEGLAKLSEQNLPVLR